mmetsp:Transcript_55696/g.97238  ORF Transcript_55696/g.97238 Transcript_55696/m.97238 type:complete len:86 (-) Transcript_55696:542-799(-)
MTAWEVLLHFLEMAAEDLVREGLVPEALVLGVSHSPDDSAAGRIEVWSTLSQDIQPYMTTELCLLGLCRRTVFMALSSSASLSLS